ncbi:MAG: type II toxin-antitoxin system HicA family toxin [Firmicutes bacterium]|nr:type II toxin-antitoxin system HicA family toxin [Bacillota bacterium]
MGKYEKLLQNILSGNSDNNINFNELCILLEKLGFKLERVSGSHHIFSYEKIIQKQNRIRSNKLENL